MSGKLKYLDTYNSIKNDIMDGKYPSGTLLPTEMELCRLYSVGRSTLRRALAMLSDEGFITSKQGHGTTVSFSAEEYAEISPLGTHATPIVPVCLLEGPHTYTSSPMAVDTILASPIVAKKMELPVGAKVFRVQRIRYVNGRPLEYLINYVNPAIVPDFDKQDIGPHITEFLVKTYGIKRSLAKGTFSIVLVDFKQSQFLGIDMGRPCFLQTRIGYVNGQVYDYSESIYNPDIIDFQVAYTPNAELDEIVPEI